MKKKRTRSEVGRRSREQGKEFERAFASYLRERYPGIDARRASQAERAMNPDVFVVAVPKGAPRVLKQVWWELTRGEHPNVGAKLSQACRDVERLGPLPGPAWIPVVVWNLRRARRESSVSLPASTLLGLCTPGLDADFRPLPDGWDPVLTLGLDAFLVLCEKNEEQRQVGVPSPGATPPALLSDTADSP